jgi:EmrB/QacA subfamily drug resistance transporter
MSTQRTYSLLALLAVTQFMVVLDVTVVNVALPSIDAALHFAPGDLQWVITAYVLFTGGLLMLGGRAADMLGRREVFLAGLLLFTGASLASGLAASPGALVASRAAQGLGAAMLTPAALSIVTTAYEGAQRARALAIWGVIGSAGAAVGVVLGGVLTTWLSWEWIFFVNVPVGLAAAAIAVRLVPRAPAVRGQLDLPGALSLVAGLAVLIYALAGAPEHGWDSARTLALLALSGGLLATFAIVERSVAHPLVPPATWRVRSLVSSAAVMLGATGILIATFFLNSLYLQNALGWSALESGLAFLPLTIAIGLGAHAASHLLPHAGARVITVAGLALMGAGALVLAVAPDRAGYALDLLPGLLAIGAGAGLVLPSVSVTGMSEVGHERAGLASGLMTTGHEVGGAIGVAVFSAIAADASGLAGGYESGFAVAAGIAGALAVAAALVVPSLRPAGAVHGAVH